MGCGASKGTETLSSPGIPPPGNSQPEFTPDTKPRPTANPEDQTKYKESRESAAKRVDAIVKSGVSDFEDVTDVTPVRPLTAEDPTVLPAPPDTPPAAAKKPLFKTADTGNLGDIPADEGTDTPFFPTQVTLNVGGPGNRQPQPSGSLPLQTSLQSFSTPQLPSLPAPEPALKQSGGGGLGGPTLAQSASSRQLQPLQQQPSARSLVPVQGQPLTESGPGPASTSIPLSQLGASAAATPDPWSSLQSTYRIRDAQAATKSDSTRSRNAGSSRDAGEEVLVLGEDDDDFSAGGALNATGTSAAMNRTSGMGGRPPMSLPPPKFGSAPKKGGWGTGAMAQAGELMLGEDDWLVNDRPSGASSGALQLPPPPLQRQPQQQQQAVMSYNSRAKMVVDAEDRHAPVRLKGPAPAPKNKGGADVTCEDVDDVDTLLEDEMERHGLSNKNLASKLAAYEAQFDDDD